MRVCTSSWNKCTHKIEWTMSAAAMEMENEWRRGEKKAREEFYTLYKCTNTDGANERRIAHRTRWTSILCEKNTNYAGNWTVCERRWWLQHVAICHYLHCNRASHISFSGVKFCAAQNIWEMAKQTLWLLFYSCAALLCCVVLCCWIPYNVQWTSLCS